MSPDSHSRSSSHTPLAGARCAPALAPPVAAAVVVVVAAWVVGGSAVVDGRLSPVVEVVAGTVVVGTVVVGTVVVGTVVVGTVVAGTLAVVTVVEGAGPVVVVAVDDPGAEVASLPGV